MKLKGNYYWMFGMQIISGIIAYPLMIEFGVVKGLIFSFIPFLIGMITTLMDYKPDERDMQLIYKTDTIKSILLTIAMAVIYMYLPSVNWFFAFIAGISLFRGFTGIIIFATN